MSEIPKIVALLSSDALEKQIAAAIILGELKAKGPEVEAALGALCASNNPILQRHALDALALTGCKRVADEVFPLLQSHADEVRRAAIRALASTGESLVPKIRARREAASPEERRALDAVLAALGGGSAFTTLLAGLAEADADPGAAKAAALALRAQLKEASDGQRKGYLAEVQAFLKAQKKAKAAPATFAAALKILGYLNDPRATATLLDYAAKGDLAPLVRQEAIIALRFALPSSKDAPKVALLLLDAATHDDRMLAQAALHTLGALELSEEHEKRLVRLISHPDLERARFVIEHLGRQNDAEAAKLLVKVLTAGDRPRAVLALAALSGNEHAVVPLARSLLEIDDRDRAWMIRGSLIGHAARVPPALRAQLLARALELLAAGDLGWEASWEVSRESDPKKATEALRDLARRTAKKDKGRSVAMLRVLCRGKDAIDDDRYELAVAELVRDSYDTHLISRTKDKALQELATLIERGYDAGAALKKDKRTSPEALYYLGFHFAEARHPIGAELLEHVIKKGGRTKLAKMAKNKLALSGS